MKRGNDLMKSRFKIEKNEWHQVSKSEVGTNSIKSAATLMWTRIIALHSS